MKMLLQAIRYGSLLWTLTMISSGMEGVIGFLHDPYGLQSHVPHYIPEVSMPLYDPTTGLPLLGTPQPLPIYPPPPIIVLPPTYHPIYPAQHLPQPLPPLYAAQVSSQPNYNSYAQSSIQSLHPVQYYTPQPFHSTSYLPGESSHLTQNYWPDASQSVQSSQSHRTHRDERFSGEMGYQPQPSFSARDYGRLNRVSQHETTPVASLRDRRFSASDSRSWRNREQRTTLFANRDDHKYHHNSPTHRGTVRDTDGEGSSSSPVASAKSNAPDAKSRGDHASSRSKLHLAPESSVNIEVQPDAKNIQVNPSSDRQPLDKEVLTGADRKPLYKEVLTAKNDQKGKAEAKESESETKSDVKQKPKSGEEWWREVEESDAQELASQVKAP